MHSIQLQRLPDGSYSAHCPQRNLGCRRPGRAAAFHFLSLALNNKIPADHPDLIYWPPSGQYPYRLKRKQD